MCLQLFVVFNLTNRRINKLFVLILKKQNSTLFMDGILRTLLQCANHPK